MPLPLPTLDRLDFAELVAEGCAALPSLAPGWTDYNAHDPGITLLELLAWLTESDSYRLDQIPAAARRAFLRLTGVTQRPAQVAETALVFQLTAGAAALTLPIATKATVRDSGPLGITFQTTRPVYVSTAKLQAIVCGSGGAFEDLSARSTHAILNFYPLGARPTPGDALYLGFNDTLAPVGTEISLWVWGADPAADRETHLRLENESAAEREEAARLCPGLLETQWDWRQHYSARTVWEYYGDNDQWQALPDVEDETRALTLTGAVRFKVPAPWLRVAGGVLGGVPGAVPIAPSAAKKFIRCRLASGNYDCPPRIAAVALNAVSAHHAADAAARIFLSTGCAGQILDIADQPVVPDSTQLAVTLSNGVQDPDWREAQCWDGVGPHDRVYVLDAERGALSFGDGRVGRVPPADAQIAVNFQLGAGAAGNLPAESLVRLMPARPDLSMEQHFAASGGAARETLDAASARAVVDLATPARAATLPDCESLALAVPGVPVARALAIADYHPDLPCIPVSGSTTIAILPPCPDYRPQPSAAMLAAVQHYIERRRLVAGEIHVVAPPYTTVAVRATLHARPGVDSGELLRRAEKALQEFFHPLRGGPDGHGWPIGRSVYRAEVLALLNGLDGVLYVDQLAWRVEGGSPRLCGNVTLCHHGLVASGNHEIMLDEGNHCHARETSGTLELLQRHGCGCSRVQD